MRKNWMKLLSFLCALMMVTGEIPVSVWADPIPATPTDLEPVRVENTAGNETAEDGKEDSAVPSAEVKPAEPPAEEKPAEPPAEEKPAADLELAIGEEAVFTLRQETAYTIRIPGRNGKMQIDAESSFPLQVEIRDEASQKTKVAKGKANEPFRTFFGGHGQRTYLLTITALNSCQGGPVKLTVTKYTRPAEEETTEESDTESAEEGDNGEGTQDGTVTDPENTDGPEEQETPADPNSTANEEPENQEGEADPQEGQSREDGTPDDENTQEENQTEEDKTEENRTEEDNELQPEEGAAEPPVTEFTCDLPGAQDISLAETISGLGIAAEDEVSSFMADIESVSVTNPEVVSLEQAGDDWSFRILKESEAQESLTISMADETVYTITTNADGIKEVTADDRTAVISTENDYYLPEEANAYAQTLSDEQGEEAVSAVQNQTADTGDASAYQVFDVGIENVNPEEYEGFQVEIKLDEELSGKDFRLYQVQDGSTTDITETLQLNSNTDEDGVQNVSAFSFTTEEFAQFVLCYTLEAFYKTFDGQTYKITVNCDPEAGVPAGSDLNIREILPEEEAYQQYLAESAEKLGVSSDSVTFARFFDIEIVDKEGKKIEPAKPAQVIISYVDPLALEGNARLSVVHFADEGTEVIRDVALSEDRKELSYEQGSFSVTGTIVTNPQASSQGEEYAIVIKNGDKYYSVANDGSLIEVEYSVENNEATVEMDYPMFWKYVTEDIDNNDANVHGTYTNLRIASVAAVFSSQHLPTMYYYRYIDPDVDSGINEEPDFVTVSWDNADYWEAVHNEGEIRKQHAQYAKDCEINYDAQNHTIKGATYYLGVNADGTGICGQVADVQQAAEVYLAKVTSVPKSANLNHTVNHIDISIVGGASFSVPLAYGTYYYEDENGVRHPFTVNAGNNVTLKMTKDTVGINDADMKNAQITAYTMKDGVIDDAFYISGYSQNEATGDDAYSQIRLEGSFKVADLSPFTYDDLDPEKVNGRNVWDMSQDQLDDALKDTKLQERLDNRIYYTVTINKELDFDWEYEYAEGKKGKVYLTETATQPRKSTVMVNMSKTFDYWDPDNECPPITMTYEGYWQAGHIVWDTTGDQGSGMDFELVAKTDGTPDVIAVEIYKQIQKADDRSVIHPKAQITNHFIIYQKVPATEADIDGVVGVGIAGSPNTASYDGYSPVHSKSIIVGQSGEGLVYDYDITQGMTYVEEDEESIPYEITDTDGTKWLYYKTETKTENVWRQNVPRNGLHTTEGLISIPEVLGIYGTWINEQNQEEELFNGFLEFYVYNIYNQAGYLKVHKAVTVNGQNPETTGDKKAVAGTYTFTVYTDEACSNPYRIESGSTRVPLTMTVTIGEDGIARDSGTAELPCGDYWIRETDPTNGTSADQSIVKVTVENDTTQANPAVADFTNNINTKPLTVKKTVSGEYTATDSDTYDITIKCGNKYVDAAQEGTAADYTYSRLADGEKTYPIKANETLTFTGLPIAEYVVTEKAATKDGYKIVTTYKVDNASVTTATASVETEEPVAVVIDNHYRSAELVITKTITGGVDVEAAADRIKVTVTDNADPANTLLDNVALTSDLFTRSGSTYTATLRSSDNEAYVEYLAPDGIYTVTEDVTDPAGYSLKSSTYTITAKTNIAETDGKTGTLQLTGADVSSGQIDFTNTYERDTGSLNIGKTVTVNGEPRANTNLADGTYSFTVSSDEGVIPVTTKNISVTITNGSITAVEGDGTLVDGKARITGLPTGTYTVTENLTQEQIAKGISFTANNAESVPVTKNNDNDIPTSSFTNNIVVGSLKITKAVKIGETPAADLVDTDSRKTLADGTYTFNIYSDATAETLATRADDSVIGDVTVEIENGQAREAAEVADLLPGDYYIRETNGSNNAVRLDSTIYKVTLGPDATMTGIAAVPDTAEATNTLPVGKLTVKKTIQSTLGEDIEENPDYPVEITVQLNGTTYYVQDVSGTLGHEPSKNLIVKPGSELVINNLPYGNYTVTESTPGAVRITGYSYVNQEGTSCPSASAPVGADPGEVELVNVYTEDASWTPQVGKLLNGENYSGKDFTYIIERAVAPYTFIESVDNADNGTVSFSKITYDSSQIDKYKYVISEVAGTDSNIQYDQTTIIYAEVEVTNDNGTLTATGKYYSDLACTEEYELSNPTFRNYELGTLKVTKKVTGDYTATDTDQYSFTVTRNGQYVNATQQAGTTNTYKFKEMTDTETPYTIKAGEDEALTFTGLPVGEYTVTETAVNKDGYTVATTYKVNNISSATGTAEVKKAEPAEVEIENHYRIAQLVITKTIIGMDAATAAADIKISAVDNKGHTILNNVSLTDTTVFVKEDSTYTATLKSTDAGKDYAQYIIPDGEYTVTETVTEPDGYSLTESKYSVTAKNDISGADAVSGNGYTFQLTEDDVSSGQIDYTNEYERDTGSLSIMKTVTVNGESVPGTVLVDGDYSFTVASDAGVKPVITKNVTVTIANGMVTSVSGTDTFADGEVSTEYGTVRMENGKAIISDLPTGAYTVTEELTDDQENKKGITIKPAGGTVSVTVTPDDESGVPTASFVNDIAVGSLKITKAVNLGNDDNTPVSSLTDARNTMADGTYTFNIYSDATAETPATRADDSVIGDVTVEIENGAIVQPAEVADLLPGTYYVRESSGSNPAVDLDGTIYPVTVEGGKTGDEVEDTATAHATNTLPVGSLRISKAIQDTNGTMDLACDYPIIVKVVVDGVPYYVQAINGELGSEPPETSLVVHTSSELTISNLPYNSYIVTESTPGASVTIPEFSYAYLEGVSVPSGTANVGEQPGIVKLVNFYIQDTSWTPQVGKLLNDINYNGTDFSYTVTFRSTSGNYTQTVDNAVNGTVSFDAIPYTLADAGKSYKYSITEVQGDDSGIEYDSRTIYAKVDISLINNSTVLNAVGRYYSDQACTQELSTPAFSNYEIGKLKVTKQVTGAYTATDADTYPITIMRGKKYVRASLDGDTATYQELTDTKIRYYIKAGQTITFDKLPVGEYTVSEENVSKDGYTISTTYKVNDTGTGTATAEIRKGLTEEVEIDNHYRNAQLKITKTISGVEPASAAEHITITVADKNGNKLLNNAPLTELPFEKTDSSYTAILNSTDNAPYAQYLVPDGLYMVTEMALEPEGYELNSSTYSINAKSTVNDATAVNGTGYQVQLAETDDSYSGEIVFKNDYKQAEPPHKKETYPGNGTDEQCAAGIGDEIIYEISYKNYKGTAADVVITDELDPNVEYVSSDPIGAYSSHIVVWTLQSVAAGKEGKVKLKVRVKDSAKNAGKVTNQAQVAVGNDAAADTEEVWNPVPAKPVKEETYPCEGTGELGAVKPGDTITYKISYSNYKTVPAKIVISDKLDENVEFVSATGGAEPNDEGCVVWTFNNVSPGTEEYVELTVKVLETAKQSAGGPGKVVNGGNNATVTVGNDSFILDEVLNPVPENPTKKETKINNTASVGNGEKGAVKVGDIITYEISVRNYKSTAATINIVDTLDEHVRFVSADENGEHTGEEKGGKVTWKIGNVGPGETRKVTLKVEVLESALMSEEGPGQVINGGSGATAWVDDDQKYELDEVWNPVPEAPVKKETEPYEGNGVLGAVGVGDEITYEISYRNYRTTAETIVIKDKLDKNVSFVSASDGGSNRNGTVTWTLKGVPAGKEGTVTLTVKVLESALASNGGPGKVINNGETATVQVGNDNEFKLDTVENPVPEPPVKSEVSPFAGTGILGTVKVGQVITYEISYRNYRTTAETIVITDKLDKNVSFVSASDGGSYKNGTVTWTLKDVPAGKEGKVTLKVKVLQSALTSNNGPGRIVNQASVQAGNDQAFETGEVTNHVSGKSPNTGDGFNTGLWVVLLILSVLGAGWFGTKALRGKKKTDRKKVSG